MHPAPKTQSGAAGSTGRLAQVQSWSADHGASMQAVQELNVKAKNWRDLLTDEPFTRKDLITIQDPHNLQARA